MREQLPVCPYCEKEMGPIEDGSWVKTCDCEDPAPIKNWQLSNLNERLDYHRGLVIDCTHCGHLFDRKDARADIAPPSEPDGLPDYILCPACALEEHEIILTNKTVKLLEYLGELTNQNINDVLHDAIKEYTDRQMEIAKKKLKDYELREQIREMMPEVHKGYKDIARLRAEIEELEN